MLALRITVPIACWRKGLARELFETEELPPPSTCYGFLLALVGEVDRDRHIGARVTMGLFNDPVRSQVLRTLWRVKSKKMPQGEGVNAAPDFQQLLVNADLLLVVDSSDEERADDPFLEERVRNALVDPGSVTRFGGLSLGESTHLVNDVWLLEGEELPKPCRIFTTDDDGAVSFPVWVDHVGTAGTRHVVGNIEEMATLPSGNQLPEIRPRAT